MRSKATDMVTATGGGIAALLMIFFLVCIIMFFGWLVASFVTWSWVPFWSWASFRGWLAVAILGSSSS